MHRLTISLLCTLLTALTPVFATNHLQADTNENQHIAIPADLSDFFQAADGFMQANVKNGMVSYSALAKDHTGLDKLVSAIGSTDLTEASKDTRIAFYLNAYNLLTIHQVVQNWPMASPLDKKGFFDATTFTVAGQQMTLNDIENKKLRPDPRVHFALVCGARGCPKIMNAAYMPDKVQTQLNMQTKKAMDDSSFIRVNGSKVEVSEIFKWYADDFVKHSGSVEAYINKYRSSTLPSGSTIGYYTYDWKVNGQ